MSELTFDGTPEQQELAAEVFRLMSMQGAFFAKDAPIRQTLTNLADYLAQQRSSDHETMAAALEQALQANSRVFMREQHDGDVVYTTSRLGALPRNHEDHSHTFKERLYQPENPLPIDDISVVVSTSRPTLTTVEPVFISDYWQQQSGLAPTSAEDEMLSPSQAEPALPYDIDGEETPPPAEAAPEQPAAVPEEPEPAAEPAGIEAVPTMPSLPAAEEESAAAPPPAPEEVAVPLPPEPAPVLPEAEHPPAEPPTVEEPATAPEPAPVLPEAEPVAAEVALGMHTFALDDGTTIDLGQPIDRIMAEHGTALKQSFLSYIDQDPLQRIVRFGGRLYPEAALITLGKNDLRRIREYIIEANEPLTDLAIMSDLYHQRQGDEIFRFSLNYRLSREKDFEFVGVDGANLWSVKGLPAIGSKRIKASEMAQLTSYLVEGYDDTLDEQEIEVIEETGALSRRITFFEWAYGTLALDAGLDALLPNPLLPDQRSAVLRFDSPQHFSSHFVEVRYPTSNRGGWLQGLEDFFREYLVPGAVIVLERTDDPSIFTISYEEIAGGAAERILTLDEKKNKFTFTDVDFFSAADEEMLPTQQRYGRLKNLKVLPTNERRKADIVMQHVFEVMGEQVGTREEPAYQADIDTLYVAYNVLRPASRSFLESLLNSHDDYVEEEPGSGIYTYRPEPQPIENEDEEEDEAIISWGYDDDE
jgi:hypothetical protein